MMTLKPFMIYLVIPMLLALLALATVALLASPPTQLILPSGLG